MKIFSDLFRYFVKWKIFFCIFKDKNYITILSPSIFANIESPEFHILRGQTIYSNFWFNIKYKKKKKKKKKS